MNSFILNDDSSSSKAYIGKEKSNNSKEVRECTWCKKNGDKYKGHTHNQSRRLKEHLRQKSEFNNESSLGSSMAKILSSPDYDFSEVIIPITIYDKAFLSSVENL